MNPSELRNPYHALARCLLASAFVSLGGCGGGDVDARRQPLQATAQVSARTPDADALFDWAERTYADWFPVHVASAQALGYTYRYYPGTGNYLGVKGNEVAVLGPATGQAITVVGTLSDFACSVFPGDCGGSSSTLPLRPFAARGSAVVGTDGSVLVFGNVSIGAGLASPVAGSTAQRIVGTSGAVALTGWSGASGLALTSTGEVLAWGHRDPSYGGEAHQWDPEIVPAIKIAGASHVRQLADFGTNKLVYLRDDGTVWTVGVQSSFPTKSLYQVQVEGLSDVVALNTGLADAGGVFAIRRDGTVWRLREKPYALGYEVEFRLVELVDVVQIDCAVQCLALTRDGRVHTFHDVDSAYQPVQTLPDMGDVVSVAIGTPNGSASDASEASALAVTRGGALWAWGLGKRGGWGREPVDLSSTPVRIADESVGVSCAGESLNRTGLVVLKDGSVWTWGNSVHVGGLQWTWNPSYVRVEGLVARTCEPWR